MNISHLIMISSTEFIRGKLHVKEEKRAPLVYKVEIPVFPSSIGNFTKKLF